MYAQTDKKHIVRNIIVSLKMKLISRDTESKTLLAKVIYFGPLASAISFVTSLNLTVATNALCFPFTTAGRKQNRNKRCCE